MTEKEKKAEKRNSEDAWSRTRLMLGDDGLERVRQSCVMIVGLGAVGGYALEAIARAGVERLRIADFDAIQESNINRQLLATRETIGEPKTALAEARIKAINPNALVDRRDGLVNSETVASLFEGDWRVDYVVDAIDTLASKVALIAETVKRGIPVMSSMGAGLRFDPSLIRVGKLTGVTNCPLSAQLRKRLRRVGVNTDDVRCAYSPEPIRSAMRRGEERFERFDPALQLDPKTRKPGGGDYPRGRPRNTLGTLPTIVGIFGLRVAHEVIMDLSGLRE
ncbi:MAG: tRNA threonylcarbamoyladenosine dehydratase [Thermoguttaceae bacterium]